MKSIFYCTLSIAILFLANCTSNKSKSERVQDLGNPPEDSTKTTISFDTQGHRGARGLLPENTIPAFLKAIDLGVKTIELDVVVSQDQQMVVSHEPFFSHLICLDAQGSAIPEAFEKTFNIYQYTVAQIKSFDCGSIEHPSFPNQEKITVSKPTLKEAITATEAYLDSLKAPKVFYNIETKSTPEGDGIYHPAPQKFAELLHQEIQELDISDRVYIQSFDVRTLQEFKKLNAEIPLVLLVYNEYSLDENIEQLGFVPSVYSPYYERLTDEEISQAHEMGMKVIPWTVNELQEMNKLKKMGVDGIISDYPNLFKDLE